MQEPKEVVDLTDDPEQKGPEKRRRDEQKVQGKKKKKPRAAPVCEICNQERQRGKCPNEHRCDGCESLNASNAVKYWRQGWKRVLEGDKKWCLCAICYLDKYLPGRKEEKKKEEKKEEKDQKEDKKEEEKEDEEESCDICGNVAEWFCQDEHRSCKYCYKTNFDATAYAAIGAKLHLNQCNGYLCKHPLGNLGDVMGLVDPDGKWQMQMFQKQTAGTGKEKLVTCSAPGCEYMEFVENSTGVMICPIESCEKRTCRACGKADGHDGDLCEEARAKDPKDENADLLKTLGAKKCPCGCLLERMDACNKVKCPGCNHFMCIVCGDLLDSSKPYAHYDRCSGEGCTEEGCKHCLKWPKGDTRNRL